MVELRCWPHEMGESMVIEQAMSLMLKTNGLLTEQELLLARIAGKCCKSLQTAHNVTV